MIDQLFQVAVAAGAPPSNVMPAVFNPVPEDGILRVWAVLDPFPEVTDTPPIVSVTLGGATPYTPVQPSSIRVNVDGVQGAGPSASDILMGPQGVRRGTNSQLTLQGGTGNTQVVRFRVRFDTMEEYSSVGAIAA